MHTGWKSRGVKAFRENCQWGSPISGFITFLLTSVLKFAWGVGPGVLYLQSPFPPHPPLCASITAMQLLEFFYVDKIML